jgi:tRNA U34 5-carboxymethylaminomethyl modifying GTPase MnmE/TrmE
LKLTERLVGKQGKYVGKIKKYYEEENLEELQEKCKRNALKQFYEGIRKIRTDFQRRTTMCKNKQVVIVGEEKDVLEVWAMYFKE